MLSIVCLGRPPEGLKLGDEVIVVPSDPSEFSSNFSAMRNFGLQKAKGDWVLFLDSDEIVSPALAAEIKLAISSSKTNNLQGFFFRRKDKFLGHWLNHGETAVVKLLRLARKNAGHWEGKVHETWKIKGDKGQFENPILHRRDLTISEFLKRLNYYSTLRAKELYENGVKSNLFLITIYPIVKFVKNWLFYLGFLDGLAGFVMAGMMGIHSFMVRGKLWLLWRNSGNEKAVVKDWEKYA